MKARSRWALSFFVVALLATLAASGAGEAAAGPKGIEGFVFDESDAPLPQALVELKCSRSGKATTVAATKTSETGRFHLEVEPTPECKIHVSLSGFLSRIIPIDKPRKSREPGTIDLGKIALSLSCLGPDVICDDFGLSPGGLREAEGLVTDESSGPLPNVLVEWKCSEHTSATTKTSETGRFRVVVGLGPECKIHLSAPGFVSRIIPIDKSPKLSEQGTIDIGEIALSLSCSSPDAICDSMTPTKPAKPKSAPPKSAS